MRLVGEVVSYVIPQAGAGEVYPVQLDFSQWRAIKKQGQTITNVNQAWLLDSNGNVSTDFTITGLAVAASIIYGTLNAAVNMILTNVNAGLPGGTPAPADYLVVVQYQLSGGAKLLAGLAVNVEGPPGGNRAPC